MSSPSTRPSGYRIQRWSTIRRRILTRDARRCYVCGGDGADQVDHVIPRSVRPDLETDPANLAAIHSDPCHRIKSEKERLAGLRRARQDDQRGRLPTEPHPGTIRQP